jgi:CheY-like chemotaxis protein
MKILVIDDKWENLNAAKKTLAGHDITICSDYDEALEHLRESFANKSDKPCSGWEKGAKKLPYWDAVLCDLLMPAGRDAQGTRGLKFVGQEMPVGWSLALVAAKRGAKYVAVASDLDHHSHPASAMLDRLYGFLKVDGALVLFTNNVNLVKIAGSEKKGKDWGDILSLLTSKI